MENFTPVTAQQNTEHQITNSVKIGKQLMKSELKKAIETLSKEYGKLREVSDKLEGAFKNQLKLEIERQVHMSISNDSEITRLRNLFTKFSRYNGNDEDDFPKFKNNLELLESFDLSFIHRVLWMKESASKESIIYQNFIKGKAFVNVSLNILDNHNEETDSDYIGNMEKLGYCQDVSISQDTLDLYFLCVENLSKANYADSECDELKYKLKNIDSVMEEMEAQLLVNELSKTEEGRKSLEITGSLLAKMLGTVPSLLDLTSK
jgi:hypothetical protein